MSRPAPSDDHRQLPAVIGKPEEANRITQAILDFVSRIPDSTVDGAADPRMQARRIASRAAQRAALTSGTLAMPPGPLGWLTLMPELMAIWKIQAQMVSDIAAAYGRHVELGREQMLYCLFRHTAAQAFRDMVVRMGDRLLFRRMSFTVMERIAKQLGVKLSRRALGEGMSRWLPVVGAVGVGAYAYYDTGQVAATTIELFSRGIGFESDGRTVEVPATRAGLPRGSAE
ncbi:MAG: hypothetical protein RSP_28340 [Rhodanobacter sp.]